MFNKMMGQVLIVSVLVTVSCLSMDWGVEASGAADRLAA